MNPSARLRAFLALAPLLLALAAIPVSAEESVGTFSIVAVDPETGEVGVAVQSKVYGVGQRVAWARGGVGAIATQAQSNESFGPDGLRLLAAGLTAEETLDWLLEHDSGRDNRQVGVVDAAGNAAAWTGSGCMDWAGDDGGAGFTCQGNILAGESVVAEMVKAFAATAGEELARRLLAALEAGQAAGGDKRGRQSAALLVGRVHPEYPEYAERYVDVRVEDHATPIAELGRLYAMYEAQGLVQAHTRFAEWLEREGEHDAARREREMVGKVLVRALAEDVQDAGTLNSLAWFTATHDLYLTDALEAAKRATALEPEDSNILDTLAEVYFRLGEIHRAVETGKRALELSPDSKYLQEQLERFESAKP